MKTNLLIIIGMTTMITISALIVVGIDHDKSINQNSSSHFDYKFTHSVTSEVYLGKTISEWQNESFDSLMSFHKIYGDAFFEQLGSLMVKNEMLNELDKQNIDVINPDFKVHSGMMLTSLPPHVSFEAFVNDTDGNTYRLSGMTNQAKVSKIGITPLKFFDTSQELPFDSILSQNNTIVIKKQNDDSVAIPRDLIISGNNDITVNFQNDLLVPIRIQSDGGGWKDPVWYGPVVLPLTTASMTFDRYGVYEWHARTLPVSGSIASDHMGGGQIDIIPDNTSKLTFHDKQQIGAAILKNSEIPWRAMGSGNDKGITLDFNRAILDALPNAKEYYKARAEQLIPFDVPIIIEEPDYNDNRK
ncbi:hypothetical protein [Nitrosopumilus sp.]|uniref:hypothetical protein n=1 Tax=Nitrosopumilus sp. TaxID=2024843 RepID=UPI00349FDB31